MNVLEEIVKKRRIRIEQQKKVIDDDEMRNLALHAPNQIPFLLESTLREPELSFILEVKKASPSKGMIVEEFPYIKIAKEYESAGANAISVLTEPDYFRGDTKYLKEIREQVDIPILRKDFIIDDYQIYEAKVIGANAILLICAILEEEILKKFLKLAYDLGLSCLVEAHDKDEIGKAVRAGARIIGVNNRNLKDFRVDLNTTRQLRQLVPPSILFLSESGIKTSKDIAFLKECNVDGVLIGETMMTAHNKYEALQALKGD